MKKLMLSIALGLLLLTSTPNIVSAAPHSSYIPKIEANAIPVFFKFQHKVRVYFTPLLSVKNVSYTLSYKTDGVSQGVTGSFDTNKKVVVVRDIPLETCSGNVCIKHKKISDMSLTVTFTYKDNSTSTITRSVSSY